MTKRDWITIVVSGLGFWQFIQAANDFLGFMPHFIEVSAATAILAALFLLRMGLGIVVFVLANRIASFVRDKNNA